MDNGVLAGVIAEVSRDERAADESAADGRTERLAAHIVRRATKAHACPGKSCRDRNHRRDVRHAALILDALDLTSADPPTAADYAKPSSYHSMTRNEAASYRGMR